MNTVLDTVVIGGGAMGSAAAWALSRRGREVTLVEQFGPGHRIGASHGATRNLNPGYHQPEYVAMLTEGLALWEELEQESGLQLLARTGIVSHGVNPHFAEVASALTAAGIRAEFLDPAEAAERWRGIRFDRQVLHMPDGGQLSPEAALPALQRLAAARGAEIRHHTKVVEFAVFDDVVRLTLESAAGTEVVTAAQAVVTAGGWTEKLLAQASGKDAGGLRIPKLTVTQEQPAHFRITDDGAMWPGFNHYPAPDY
ncbi:MAG: FAD-dependent oxidoreductase, partial [Pseudarthrobacter sp.]|nr:FAD-dependent oxidoreductase [Pseudarthrobacter sp.]